MGREDVGNALLTWETGVLGNMLCVLVRLLRRLRLGIVWGLIWGWLRWDCLICCLGALFDMGLVCCLGLGLGLGFWDWVQAKHNT